MHKIAYIFPGQGAQYVGMGKDFYDHFEAAKRVFEEADEHLHRHFSQLIFEGPQTELTQTKNSQMAIYIMSWAVYRALQAECPEIAPIVCAGLSLGEYTALVAAGKLSFLEGLSLVEKRALLMQQACESFPGSMRVVLGLEDAAVEDIIAPISASAQVWVANLNCPGQVVIAGTLSGLDLAAELLKQKGAKRILPLDVSGAFHSGLMQSAKDRLAPYIAEVPLRESSIDIVMNTPGDYVKDTALIRQNLIDQVTQPVRWQRGIQAIERSGVSLFLEIGCGKTLQGMNKRIGVKVPTLSLEKIEELQQVVKGVDTCSC